jgi:hypothetical protein
MATTQQNTPQSKTKSDKPEIAAASPAQPDRAAELETMLADATATIRRQSQQLELLAAEKQARAQDEELKHIAAAELTRDLNALRAQNQEQTREIARLTRDLKAAGDPTMAAQVTASVETINRLRQEIETVKAENVKLRATQGSHQALTADQVTARLKGNPRSKFMAIQPYTHGSFSAVRGQSFLGHLHPNLPAHARNGLLLVAVDDVLSGLTEAAA